MGAKTVRVDVMNIKEARDYIETHYRPLFEKKLQSMGVNKKESVWENSNILLNGKVIIASDNTIFKKGDRLDLIPLVAGG